MRTKTTTVYVFGELSAQAQEVAISRLSDINVKEDWWDTVYEGAETIGLKITSFDLNHGTIKGVFTGTGHDAARQIMEEHGDMCETYRDAKAALDAYAALPLGEYGEPEEDALESWESEWLNTLLEDYRIILGHEYDYLTSREAIVETIKANDYEFTADGRLA